MDNIKVLILSGEIWQDGSSGGNVLTGMFKDSNFELAQVYCNPGTPQNKLCKRYFQITDYMVLRSFLRHKPIGKSFVLQDVDCKNYDNNVAQQKNRVFDKFVHKHNLRFFHFVKNFLWNHSNWKNDKLKKFILDFDPDIIFAPCYGDKFMLRLTRFVADYTVKNVISYISDDSYSLKQINFSLFYWINRISVRHQMRKTFPYYSLCYTMTDIQKKQCEKHFNANMKILLKPVDVVCDKKESVQVPIKIIYAGGVYLNRWKTLAKLVKAIKKVNDNCVKFKLDIYTSNYVSKKIDRHLNDKVNSEIHKSVYSKELFEIYKKSDIALHVESFDLKNRLAVRMSFSTKITDCLSSGCAVMAICDKKQGGFDYLRKNDLAICIDNLKDIENVLQSIIANKQIVLDYASKAFMFANSKHNADKIRKDIKQDFLEILK